MVCLALVRLSAASRLSSWWPTRLVVRRVVAVACCVALLWRCASRRARRFSRASASDSAFFCRRSALRAVLRLRVDALLTALAACFASVSSRSLVSRVSFRVVLRTRPCWPSTVASSREAPSRSVSRVRSSVLSVDCVASRCALRTSGPPSIAASASLPSLLRNDFCFSASSSARTASSRFSVALALLATSAFSLPAASSSAWIASSVDTLVTTSPSTSSLASSIIQASL
mmetsp:Transcript_14551/g.31609  ORF Transcript_14551/g.31609 Transcript_14551/m.31609 type:complete len:230 (+) Transcript_14551:1148-1837(+)